MFEKVAWRRVDKKEGSVSVAWAFAKKDGKRYITPLY